MEALEEVVMVNDFDRKHLPPKLVEALERIDRQDRGEGIPWPLVILLVTLLGIFFLR